MAAALVLLTHARASVWVSWGKLPLESHTPSAALLYTISRFGHESVILFFVLSGYLVGGKLIERVRFGTFQPMRYVVDRCTRIYVPYVPALVLSGLACWLVGREVQLADFGLNLLQLQHVAAPSFAGNVALWSLSYEAWFYVLGGLCALACVGPHHARGFSVVLLSIAFAVFAKLLPIYLLCWIVGAVAYASGPSVHPRRDATGGLILLVGGAALSQYAFQIIPHDFVPGGGFDAKATALRQVAFLVMCGGASLLLNVITHAKPGMRWCRIERLGATLASGSYTLYLTHYPVLMICESVDPNLHRKLDACAFIAFAIRLALCALVAWGFYRLFERNTDKVRTWCMGGLAKASFSSHKQSPDA